MDAGRPAVLVVRSLLLPLLHDNRILVIVAHDGAFHDDGRPDEIVLVLKLGALELFQQTMTLK